MTPQPEPIDFSERHLARDFAAGEPGAFDALYEALGEKVFRLIYRLTRDRDAAADLTHDTFVRVMEKRSQFSRNGSLPGWVFRIATNLTMDRFRRGASRRLVDDVEAVEAGAAPSFRPPGPGSHSGSPGPAMETRLTLRQALDGLREGYRLVLVLHDIDGYTHDEIAEMLEIAPGTSKARLSRGRAMMRSALEGAS